MFSNFEHAIGILLLNQVHVERSQNKNLEAEVQLASEELKKFAKHREVVMKLLTKRSVIVKDIDDTQCNITALEETLRKAEDEARRIEVCVANECSNHSHIESAAEQQFGVAAKEHEQLLARLSCIESQNRELDTELDRLRGSVDPRCRNNPVAHESRSAIVMSHNLTLLSDGVPAVNDTGTASQMRHVSNVVADMSMHGSLEAGDIRLLPSKFAFESSRAVAPKKGSEQTLEPSVGASRHSHHVVPARHLSDIQMIRHVESVNSTATATPTMVSVTTNSGLRVSVAVSPRPPSQVLRQVPPTGAPGRGAPPPVPPNKPQVFITQPQLPASSASASRVAQPSRPQAQARYGAAFPQDRVPDKPSLTSAAVTGSRQTPAPTTATGTSSHLAMVVGETSAVHKHPSQVCVNIK